MASKKSLPAQNKTQSSSPPWYQNPRTVFWLLFMLGAILYANTLSHDYTQDDAIVIYDNEFTQKGIAGIPDILTHDTFRGFFKEAGKDKLVAGGRYRPFTLLMFALEWEIAGRSPWLGHLINALLYGLTGGILFLLLKTLLLRPKKQPYATFVALSASLLFLAHPIHTEAVANIKGRDEMVAFLGSISALFLAIKAYQANRNVFLLPALGLFFIALLSKENTITFLAIIPLTFYVFTEAKTGQILRITLPFLGVAVLFLLIRGAVIGWDLGDPPRELMNNPYLKIVDGKYVDFTLGERLATVFFSLGLYLKLLFFPHPLTHDYYPRQIDMMTWADPLVWLSLLIYLSIGTWAILQIRKKDHLAFAIFYFIITLSIVSNLFFPIGTHLSERFLYMPSLGFSLAISILLYRLVRLKEKKITLSNLKSPALLILGISCLFAFKTIHRNQAWKDNFTLFKTDVVTSKSSAKLRNSVGGEYITQAIRPENETEKEQMLRIAISHLEEAVRLHPTYKNAWLLLGNAHNYLQDYEKSIELYNNALKLDPAYKEAQNNLEITYRQAGRYFGEQKGDLQRSLRYLQLAYQANPDDYETVRLLGIAHGIAGNQPKAIEFFLKAVSLQPENADAWWNLASAYHYNQQPEKALECQQKAIQLDPEIQNRK